MGCVSFLSSSHPYKKQIHHLRKLQQQNSKIKSLLPPSVRFREQPWCVTRILQLREPQRNSNRLRDSSLLAFDTSITTSLATDTSRRYAGLTISLT